MSTGEDRLRKPEVGEAGTYRLHLFVAGDEVNSRLARENLKEICEVHLGDACELEVTDVLQDFATALKMGVYVTPALVIQKPKPAVTIFGNLRDRDKVLRAMGLEETADD